MSPFLVLPRTLAKPLRWPTESVTRARRNARLASAALAVRKAEREDVARFLADHDATAHATLDASATSPGSPVSAPVSAPVNASIHAAPQSARDLAIPQPRQHRLPAEQRR
jgi:hypothetical protein